MPMATPAIDDSARGVSMTRSSPNFSTSPIVAPKTPPLREQTHALQVGPKRQEGIAFPDLFQLLSRAIPLLLIIAAVRSQAWDGEFDQRGPFAALGPIVRLPGDAEALQDVASIRGHA